MVTHSSILAWRIPWTEEPDRLQSMIAKSRTRLSDFTITIQSYLRKLGKSQINSLTFRLKQLEKEEQAKPKVSKRKEIVKMREVNEIEKQKTIAKFN